MQRLEVSCAVRPIYGSLGAKGLRRARYVVIIVHCTGHSESHCALIKGVESQLKEP
jgi:hypothetical protein